MGTSPGNPAVVPGQSSPGPFQPPRSSCGMDGVWGRRGFGVGRALGHYRTLQRGTSQGAAQKGWVHFLVLWCPLVSSPGCVQCPEISLGPVSLYPVFFYPCVLSPCALYPCVSLWPVYPCILYPCIPVYPCVLCPCIPVYSCILYPCALYIPVSYIPVYPCIPVPYIPLSCIPVYPSISLYPVSQDR